MAITEYTTLQKKDRYKLRYKNFNWIVPENYNFGFDVVDQWAEDITGKKMDKLTEEHIS